LFSWRNLNRARQLPAFMFIPILILIILIHACTHAAAEPDGHRYSSDLPGIWTRDGVRRCSIQAPGRPIPTFYCGTVHCPASTIMRQGKARHVPNGQVRLLYSSLYKHCMACGKRQLFFRQQRSRVAEQQPGWLNSGCGCDRTARRLNISVICSAEYHRWQK
jgi:hypothetical protein